MENLTIEQYRLLFTAVRFYQTKRSLPTNDEKLYGDCEDLLDLIYPHAYFAETCNSN